MQHIAGMVITEMMDASYYARMKGLPYGGYCPDLYRKHQVSRAAAVQHILQTMGWNHLLPMACPNATLGQGFTDRKLYHSVREPPSTFFTNSLADPWLQEMRHHTTTTRAVSVDDDKTKNQDMQGASNSSSLFHDTTMQSSYFRVAIHIRRGDVTPCSEHHQGRYLPNAHYLALLQHFLPPTPSHGSLSPTKRLQQLRPCWMYRHRSNRRACRTSRPIGLPHDRHLLIQIFSVSDSPYENWTLFEDACNQLYQQHGNGKHPVCQLELDTPQGKVWKHIVTANVVFLSKSTFSYTPAMFQGQQQQHVVYTPFPRRPLDTWRVAPPDIVQESHRIVTQELAHHAKCRSDSNQTRNDKR